MVDGSKHHEPRITCRGAAHGSGQPAPGPRVRPRPGLAHQDRPPGHSFAGLHDGGTGAARASPARCRPPGPTRGRGAVPPGDCHVHTGEDSPGSGTLGPAATYPDPLGLAADGTEDVELGTPRSAAGPHRLTRGCAACPAWGRSWPLCSWPSCQSWAVSTDASFRTDRCSPSKPGQRPVPRAVSCLGQARLCAHNSLHGHRDRHPSQPCYPPLLYSFVPTGQAPQDGTHRGHAQVAPHPYPSSPGPGPLAAQPRAHGWRGMTLNTSY